MKRRRYTYRPTKPFEEFTRKRFSNGEEILVISREPNRPFRSRFQPSQLIQTLKKLVDIRNSTIELLDGKFLPHPIPRPSRPDKLQESKTSNLL
jgi:hypothetical protein